MRVGLTGGIGSGKSEVARILEELGAYVIDADALAREAVAPNSDGLMQIARTWPQVVRNNALDRTALAEIVFSDADARARLNAIVHPHVRRLAREREALAKPGQMIVHVVPLLFETNYLDDLERRIVVIAPEEQRIARMATRDGMDEARMRARMAAQIAPEEARRRADAVIENDADLATLRERTRALYERLLTES
ncbi:MAG TPA: dephospho-CoA kinase [Candidatus Tyrphobacter sp.]